MPGNRVVAAGTYAALIAILVGTIVAAGFHVLAAQWAAAASAAVPILITLLVTWQARTPRKPQEDAARDLAGQLALQARDNWAAELPGRGLEPGRLMEVHWRRAAGSSQVSDHGILRREYRRRTAPGVDRGTPAAAA